MYPIYYDEKECGNAIVDKQGLYYRIICKCKIPTNAPCKITVQIGERNINLGTCIKAGNIYTVDTKIPCKYLASKNLKFNILSPKKECCQGFVPVGENVPFPHLNKLNKARMCHRNGQIGIVFTE